MTIREEFSAELINESRKNQIRIGSVGVIVFGQILAIASKTPGYGWAFTIFAGLLVALPFVGLWIFLSELLYRRLASSAPTFSSDGSTLRIEVDQETQIVSLSDCVVKRGRACHLWLRGQRGGITLWSFRKVILIYTPRLRGGEVRGSIAAVGFTDDMLNQWHSLLNDGEEKHCHGRT